MRYAGGLGWPRLSGKTGEFSAGSMATRAGFRITHWQSRPSFAVYSGWTWRKTAFILPILGLAALGELRAAATLLPGLETELARSYALSFVHVLYALAGLATLIAALVFVLLRKQGTTSSAVSAVA